MTNPIVFTALYEYRAGHQVCVFKTAAGAERWRQRIAVGDWEQEVQKELGNIPEDPAKAADAYFEAMSERESNGEWFSVERQVLLG